MHEAARRFIAFFLPAVTVATLGCLLLAAAIQQDLRQGANDPQVAMAEDAVARLDAGEQPSAVVGSGHVDVAASLDPFVAVYNEAAAVLASDGILDGAAPRPPVGVLATASQEGQDRVTWQPRAGVRVAAVVLRWNGGTVLAGRSW